MTATSEELTTSPSTSDRSRIRKVVAASTIGTTIEWYDFFLYGSAAALIFGDVFFPGEDPVMKTLLSLGTFAVGFIARPLGGVVFGYFGDRFGRKNMLVISVLLMGVATVLIGLLPGYDSIGLAAPILLVTLRILQGIGLGGEWGGGVLMIVEHSAEQSRRGFYASWMQAAAPIGLILSTMALSGVSAFTTDEQFMAWGWRIPFIASIILVAVGLFIRLQIEESPLFKELQAQPKAERTKVITVVRQQWKFIAIAFGVGLAQQVAYYVINVYGLQFGTENAGIPRDSMLQVIAFGAPFQFAGILIAGHLSDRIGRKPIQLVGAVLLGVSVFGFFPMLSSQNMVLVFVAVAVSMFFQGMLYGPLAAYTAELFPTAGRYTATSLSYQLMAIVGGGLTPLFAVALLQWTGTSMSISLYMVAACVIGIVALLIGPETSRRNLRD